MSAPSLLHITPLFQESYWFPVCFWVQFTMLVITYRTFHGMGTGYLRITSFWLYLFIQSHLLVEACYGSHLLKNIIWWVSGREPFRSWRPLFKTSSPRDWINPNPVDFLYGMVTKQPVVRLPVLHASTLKALLYYRISWLRGLKTWLSIHKDKEDSKYLSILPRCSNIFL